MVPTAEEVQSFSDPWRGGSTEGEEAAKAPNLDDTALHCQSEETVFLCDHV